MNTFVLPKDQELPAIIREIVSNAPSSRKVPAFVASLSPLCALCSRVRLQYYYDSRPSALLLQVLIEGAQSSGKSFAADIESLIMDNTLKLKDQAMRRAEQEYRELKKRRRANEKVGEEPQTTIRVVPATISKTVLTKRADMFQRVLKDTLTFWMFAEELAQVTDAGKQGYSNLRTIMRTAYDLGSQFGIDFASDNSYSAIVDINICSMFCATPSAVDDYYDKKAIEGGNVTRCLLCPLDDDLGQEGAIFIPYSPEQKKRIDSMLSHLMSETYDEDGGLQPVVDLDMSWLNKTICRWIKEKGHEAALSGNKSLDVFRKRSSVTAFRVAALCYYLYGLEGAYSEEKMQRLCRKIYLYMAEYTLNSMLNRWGKSFDELNQKRDMSHMVQVKPVLFEQLTSPFTRDQLKLKIEELGLTTPAKVFLCMWRKMRVIREVDKNTFEKLL